MAKTKETIEFGDFQTPIALAKQVADVVSNELTDIETIIEPTCGTGTFLRAFIENDYGVNRLVGWEINPAYVDIARKDFLSIGDNRVAIDEQDFFELDWACVESKYKEPILFIGNPPWVTSAELGKLLSKNIPQKSNFQKHSGLEAITGKSNFDISEWMLIKIADYISNTNSAMAFLIKTAVARKIFLHITKNKLAVNNIFVREIDAKKHFDVSVGACLFYAQGTKQAPDYYVCPIYTNLETDQFYKKMGVTNNQLIASIDRYSNLADIDCGCEFKWRSGIKHDCSKVMEFTLTNNRLVNGYKELIDIPDHYLYPMYKSSHIAKETLKEPEKLMLVTQKKMSEETDSIAIESPKTWKYLIAHSNVLDARKSSIYKNAPRFAIFGIGDYTFKDWKIAISGLYKNLKFNKIGSHKGKPIVLDDTCYMLGFDTEEEAQFILELLESNVAKQFVESLVFKDNKRPITTALLNRINIRAIAVRLQREKEYDELFTTVNEAIKLENVI